MAPFLQTLNIILCMYEGPLSSIIIIEFNIFYIFFFDIYRIFLKLIKIQYHDDNNVAREKYILDL